jgi:hypothetical protein
MSDALRLKNEKLAFGRWERLAEHDTTPHDPLRNIMPKFGVSPPRSDGGARRGCPSKWSIGSRHNPE